MITEKLNLTKSYPEYYKASTKPNMVNLEPYHYLTISGKCAPENEQFLEAVGLLYKAGYTMKRVVQVQSLDFVVPKMEAFWWVESGIPFDETPRDEWYWQIKLRMPDFVGKQEFQQVREMLVSNISEVILDLLKFEEIHEGLSAQILHHGSYDDEGESLQKLYQFIEKEGFVIIGRHHEIYLNDPARTAPEKLKTILRYAIA